MVANYIRRIQVGRLLEEAPLISHYHALASALLLFLLSIAVTLSFRPLDNANPGSFDWITRLKENDVGLLKGRQFLISENTIFLDTRSERVYQFSHIPGALNLTLQNIDTLYTRAKRDLTGKTLITYCSSPRCPKADILRDYLVKKGHTDVRVLRPGFSAWHKEGLPLEHGL